MKITEQLFKIPIIMYDGKQLRRAAKKEEEMMEADLDLSDDVYVEYCICTMKLPIDEVVGYYQSWSRDVSVKEAKEGALDCTLLMTKTLGDYMVYWKLSRFESEYEAHYEKFEKFLQTFIPISSQEGKKEDIL